MESVWEPLPLRLKDRRMDLLMFPGSLYCCGGSGAGGEVEWRVGRGVEVVDRGHVVRSEGGSAVGIGASVHGLAPAVVVGGFLRCAVLVPGGAVIR